MTDLNDSVSSVIVGPGCTIELFDDPGFQGARSESAACPAASGPIVHYNAAVFTTAQAASDFVGHALGTQFQIHARDAPQTVVRVANGVNAIVGRIDFDHATHRFTRVELY